MLTFIIMLHGLFCFMLGSLITAWIIWDMNRNKAKDQ